MIQKKQITLVSYVLMFFIFTLMLVSVMPTYAEINVQPTKPPIKIGMSADLTGPNSQNGEGMKTGVEVYFAKTNDNGGIQGQKLNLIVLDDGYDPTRAANNVRQLIEKAQVLALIGNTGTPTATVILPIIIEKKVLLFAPRSGAPILRQTPSNRYVINVRTGYIDEIASAVKGLISIGIKPEEVALFTQNDSFGDSIYQSTIKAFKENGFPNVTSLANGSYERNTTDVIAGLANIVQELKQPPKVFILGGLNLPNAKFVNLTIKQYPNALFFTVSGLINASDLDKAANGQVILSQVMPPVNTNLPIIKEYHDDLQKYAPHVVPSYISLEGYVAAKLFVLGLKKASENNQLTREGIIDTFDSMRDIDIGIGVPISLGKNDHSALQKSWLTIFKNGSFVPFNWSDLKKSVH